jgi:hypothetical protein
MLIAIYQVSVGFLLIAAETYSVLITDEYGHMDVLADGFATRRHAERFMSGVKRYKICNTT